jgi:hypothetical protein
MKCLVDTDVLVYQAANAATTIMEADHGDDFVLFPTVSLGEATTIFDHLVEQIRDMTEADELYFALSAPSNFRKTLYADYKANRWLTVIFVSTRSISTVPSGYQSWRVTT